MLQYPPPITQILPQVAFLGKKNNVFRNVYMHSVRPGTGKLTFRLVFQQGRSFRWHPCAIARSSSPIEWACALQHSLCLRSGSGRRKRMRLTRSSGQELTSEPGVVSGLNLPFLLS